jgi:hypothetical protein
VTRRGRRETTSALAGTVAVATLMSAATTAPADDRLAVEFFAGTAASIETRLVIEQAGQPDIEFRARYATRPFEPPLYWMFRFNWLREASRWELQLTHHKLYLENNPPEVQHFEITHGYNFLTVNRAFATRHLTWRVGAGAVIAHTESEVRGQREDNGEGGLFDRGYELAGPVLLGGAGRPLELSKRFFLTPEIQLTAAWARVSTARGHATAPNVAFHFVLGIGFLF